MHKVKKPDGNEEFRIFQEEFKKHQKHFGLMGYKVYFECLPFNDDFGGIKIEQDDMVVTVRLNSKLPKREQPYGDVRRTARHEAIHLLMGRVVKLGGERYINGSELYEAAEELAHKLENLLPQLED